MVFPLIGAALGAGANIFSGILGANAAEEETNMNWAINLYNNRQRRKERQESMEYAEGLRTEGKLGATDAEGTRTHFVDGKGWVTDLGNKPQELLNYFYGHELPERRAQFDRKAVNSREANDIAGSLFDEFRRIQKANPRDVESQLYEKASRGIGESTDAAMSAAMRTALQSGSSNAGKVAASISREAMKAGGDAAKDAALQADDYASDQYNSRRGQQAGLLAQFLQAAGADIGASYDPTGKVDNANNLMRTFSQGDDAAQQIGANAVNKTMGSLDPVEARNGPANAWASAGNSLAALGNRVGSYTSMNKNNALLEQFLTQGGQLDFGQGGIFGAMTDRVKPNAGFF